MRTEARLHGCIDALHLRQPRDGGATLRAGRVRSQDARMQRSPRRRQIARMRRGGFVDGAGAISARLVEPAAKQA